MSKLSLPFLSSETAPEPVASTLRDLKSRYGFLPNLYGGLAHAPPALHGYLALAEAFGKGTLSATERNIVLLAASQANGCHYCVAVHSTIADMQKDEPAVTDALREGWPVLDARLDALRRLTEALVRGRGHAEREIAAFLAVGYAPAQVLEVLVGIAMKTLSNYANHLLETPLDAAFAARAWSPAGDAR